MSTQPFPGQRERDLRDSIAASLALVRQAAFAVLHGARTVRASRRRARMTVADQPWRLGIGMTAVLVPSALLALAGPDLPVTTPGIILLVAVAFSTYLADWVGGMTALLLSATVLDFFFVGERRDFGFSQSGAEMLGFFATMVAGAGLVWLIQSLKLESIVDRRNAVSARAAAAALASVEAAAATSARGAVGDRAGLNRSLLRAMVSINRAHGGALFLSDPNTGALEPVASYGIEAVSERLKGELGPEELFVHRIALERRSRWIGDIHTDRQSVGSMFRGTNLRSLLGVPLMDEEDRLLGVVVVGLLVPHKFTHTEIARLEALALRSSAVLEAAVGINARETALHSATESKRWLELVIAAMPEAVILATPPDGRIIAENQAAIALLGRLTGDELSSELSGRLTFPDGEPVDQERSPIHEAFRLGEIVAGTEMLARSPAGVQMPVLVSAAPVRETEGPVVAVVAVFRDIAALKEASRLKDEFVSVVSHELRSPLTPIRGFVQLVARDLAREGGHDPQVGRLNSIAGHVDRMTRLVDDLLDVSRLKSGSLEIRRGVSDLGALCEDVIRDRAGANSAHSFSFTPPDEPVIGDWDADRLYQVIDNLVGNAIKYSRPGGTITIATELDRDVGDAIVRVIDDGPGISVSDKARVFSAFYRTPEAAASQVAGLGLGLYICHELVVAHGGTIEIDDAPGGGAMFTIRLPVITRALAA